MSHRYVTSTCVVHCKAVSASLDASVAKGESGGQVALVADAARLDERELNALRLQLTCKGRRVTVARLPAHCPHEGMNNTPSDRAAGDEEVRASVPLVLDELRQLSPLTPASTAFSATLTSCTSWYTLIPCASALRTIASGLPSDVRKNFIPSSIAISIHSSICFWYFLFGTMVKFTPLPTRAVTSASEASETLSQMEVSSGASREACELRAGRRRHTMAVTSTF